MLELIGGLLQLGFYLGGLLIVTFILLGGIDYAGMVFAYIISKKQKSFKEFKDEWDRT